MSRGAPHAPHTPAQGARSAGLTNAAAAVPAPATPHTGQARSPRDGSRPSLETHAQSASARGMRQQTGSPRGRASPTSVVSRLPKWSALPGSAAPLPVPVSAGPAEKRNSKPGCPRGIRDPSPTPVPPLPSAPLSQASCPYPEPHTGPGWHPHPSTSRQPPHAVPPALRSLSAWTPLPCAPLASRAHLVPAPRAALPGTPAPTGPASAAAAPRWGRTW